MNCQVKKMFIFNIIIFAAQIETQKLRKSDVANIKTKLNEDIIKNKYKKSKWKLIFYYGKLYN